MPLPSRSARRHDPFWDMDGKAAHRARLRRKAVRAVLVLLVVLTIGMLGTSLPAVDPAFVLSGEGRPILAGALLTLLASTILIGLSWMRRPAH